MKKIKEMLLSNTISSLTVNELKNTFGGTVPLENPDDDVKGGPVLVYCKWTCTAGASAGQTGATVFSNANSVATSVCGAGNFTKICQ